MVELRVRGAQTAISASERLQDLPRMGEGNAEPSRVLLRVCTLWQDRLCRAPGRRLSQKCAVRLFRWSVHCHYERFHLW